MKKVNCEVWENNGGGILLVILDENNNPVRIFENWEYGNKGILYDALMQLMNDPNAYETWDGDLIERLTEEHHIATAQHIYSELIEWDERVAWVENNRIFMDFAKMGYNALDAMNSLSNGRYWIVDASSGCSTMHFKSLSEVKSAIKNKSGGLFEIFDIEENESVDLDNESIAPPRKGVRLEK